MVVTSHRKAVVTLPTDIHILIAREFDAPWQLVYEVYSTPEFITRWWSPNRANRQRARGPRSAMGADIGFGLAFTSRYKEITPHRVIAVTEIYEGDQNGESAAVLVTVAFSEKDGRTRLTMLIELPCQEVRDAMISAPIEPTVRNAFDQLERVVLELRQQRSQPGGGT